MIHVTRIDTQVGEMVAAATSKGLCMLEFADNKHLDRELNQLANTLNAPLVVGNNPLFDQLSEQLDQYFDGERREFDIPLDLVGTEFQKKVWLSLLQIPYGETASYGEQARLLGMPTSARAVANANGKNKVCIILPCHRVIGSDGSLTGYGGGLWRKEKLLTLEKLTCIISITREIKEVARKFAFL